MIEKYHPVDPDTKDKLLFKDRITVKDYESKLSDICFCYAAGQHLKRFKKFVSKKCGESKKVRFKKP